MKIFTILPILFFVNIAFSQSEQVMKWMDEGVALHDKGEFKKAIVLYDKILAEDKNFLPALTEKSLSLFSLKKYEDGFKVCEHAIKTNKSDPGLAPLYVNYAVALDHSGNTDKSIQTFKEGLRSFPESFQLHFNLGVTLANHTKYADALESIQQAAMLNPLHPGSQFAIAQINFLQKRRIESIMAILRFLELEAHGPRAPSAILILHELMNGNITKEGNENIIHTTTPTDEDDERFRALELGMDLSSVMHIEKNSGMTQAKQLTKQLNSLFTLMKEGKKGTNFYWMYYVPYFVEMETKSFTEIFVNLIYLTEEDTDWVMKNQEQIEKYLAWSENFQWYKGE